KDNFKKAKAYAQRALDLDPINPDVLATMGHIFYCEAEFFFSTFTDRRALDHQARDPEELESIEKAKQYCQEALRIDPL
ncbi:hypothetical protein ABTO47_19930, partial [Acinetobacter baumannii]